MGYVRLRVAVATLAAALLALVAASLVLAAAGDVDLISRVGSNGASGNGASTEPDASQDGHLVGFLSRATNLTADTVPGTFAEAFVRDATSGSTTLASRGDAGTAANAAVSDVSISDDGNIVAFDSRATNLVTGVTAGGVDRAYVRNIASGTTTLVEQVSGDDALRPEVSADGRFVAFASHANYDGASGASLKVYVRDLQAATFELVSRADGPAGTTLVGDQPSISSDGRYVAFRGQGGDIPNVQVLVRDRTLHTTTIASRSSGADGAAAASAADEPAISASGRYVAFRTSADNLSGEDGDGTADIFERDLSSGTTTLVSRADGPAGAAGTSGSEAASVSSDGRRVLFISQADNLAPDDNDAGDNAYVRDTVAGSTTLVHGTPGQTPPPQGVMAGVSLSADGIYAVYDTSATVLPAQESGAVSDVFRRDLGSPTTPPAPPHLDVADAVADEGNTGGGGHLHFAVTLSAAAAQPVTVDWATSDGSATAGSDYVADNGQIVIEPGQTSADIAVTAIGDGAVEGDETFNVTLSNPQQATLGRATAIGTIRNDDVSSSPPPGPSDHSLLGSVGYEPPFGVGVKGLDALGPFDIKQRPPSIFVALRDGSGSELARTAALDPVRTGPAPYRLDDLPACSGCSLVVLDGGGAVHDSRPVSFPGDAGQSRADLVYDRSGGAASGVVHGGHPGELSVSILDAGGHTLATSSSKTSCAAKGKRGAVCPKLPDYPYRITGLPFDARPVTAVLEQTAGKTSIPVDSAELTLDPAGETHIPDLTAETDVPGHPRGRVLFGRVDFRAPFAPGARRAKDLELPSGKNAPKVSVELVDHSGAAVASSGVLRAGYELDQLPKCSGCTVVLREDKRVVSREKVDIAGPGPSVRRLDLHYAKAGDPEFLDGVVVNGAVGTPLAVVVTDAASRKVLTDSRKRGTFQCPKGGDCVRSGRLLYRLGSLPPDRDVVVTLFAGREGADIPVDSQRLRLEPEGQITEAPDLLVPLGRVPGRPTRVLDGHVRLGGAYAPGGASAAPPAGHQLSVRLVDPTGAAVATGAVAADKTFRLDDVPACAGCSLELLSDGTTVQDRAGVDVAPEVGTTRQDLSFDELPGGSYVQGSLVVPKGSTADKLRVQVLGPDGALLADSKRLPAPCVQSPHGHRCRSAKRFDYRLGAIPAGTGRVTLVALQGSRRLASAHVDLPGGTADAQAPDLEVAPR